MIQSLGQSLFSWIHDWFKPLAYSIILLREQGIPCVFYGDYFGIPSEKVSAKNEILDKLLLLRKDYAYGDQHDYFDHNDVVGWTREGDQGHSESGMAVLMTDKDSGEKQMYVGKHFANMTFYDFLGHVEEKVIIDENGNGLFKVNGGSVSVWVKE